MKHKHTQRRTLRWKRSHHVFFAHNRVEEDLPLPTFPGEEGRYEKVLDDIKTRYSHLGNFGITGGTGIFGSEEVILPTFSDRLKGHLPSMLEKVIELSETPYEADVYLLATLTAVSSGMTNCLIQYNRHWYYPPLMTIVTGGPASGKSKAHVAKYIVSCIDAHKIHEEEQNQEEGQTNSDDKKARVKKITHFLPADSTAAAFDQTLVDNDGMGLLECTEIDTLTRNFGSEYGDFSATIRKNYEHETIEINRVKQDTILRVEKPRFAVVLAGTPGQVAKLIPSASNGEYSRYLFYCLPSDYKYRVILNEQDADNGRRTDEEEFSALGLPFYRYWQQAIKLERIEFKVSDDFLVHLERVMQYMQDQCRELMGDGIISVLHRLGSYTMKLTAALTYLRSLDRDMLGSTIYCEERDFNNALVIVETVLIHSLSLYGSVVRPAEDIVCPVKGPKMNVDQKGLYERLHEEFSTQEFQAYSRELNIPPDTSNKWLRKWREKGLVESIRQGKYRKTEK